MTAKEVRIVSKDSIGKSVLIGVVWVVFMACVVALGVALISGGCTTEKQRAVVRVKPSPVAGPTDTAEKIRARAYELEGKSSASWTQTKSFIAPPDKRFLSTKDRLKVTQVEAQEAYVEVKEQAAFIQADLKGDQARFQTSGAYRKYENQRKVATEKMAALRKKFLAETGITVDEAAAAFEPKKQGGAK